MASGTDQSKLLADLEKGTYVRFLGAKLCLVAV